MFVSVINAYPAFWVFGMAFAFWPVLFFASLRTNKIGEPSAISNALMFLGLVQIFSIPIGYLYFETDLSRTLGGINNALVWITVSILVRAKISVDQQARLAQGLINIALFQGVIVLLAKILYPKLLPFPLFQQVSRDFGVNASSFADRNVVYIDWFEEFTQRTSGIMGHATWAGGFSALAIILLLKFHIESKKPFYKYAPQYLLLGYVVFLSLSRSVLVVSALTLFTVFFARLTINKPSVIKVAAIFVAAISVIFLLFLGLVTNVLQEFLTTLNEARAGSILTRGDIYSVTLDYLQRHPLPLIGFGIKPKGEGLVASIGTHSTFLGVLFKGGLLGLLAFLFFVIVSLRNLIKRKNFFGLAIFVFITLWCLLEDFDGGHLIPLFFVLIYRAEFEKGYETTSTK